MAEPAGECGSGLQWIVPPRATAKKTRTAGRGAKTTSSPPSNSLTDQTERRDGITPFFTGPKPALKQATANAGRLGQRVTSNG